jgi:hypothetical protein
MRARTPGRSGSRSARCAPRQASTLAVPPGFHFYSRSQMSDSTIVIRYRGLSVVAVGRTPCAAADRPALVPRPNFTPPPVTGAAGLSSFTTCSFSSCGSGPARRYSAMGLPLDLNMAGELKSLQKRNAQSAPHLRDPPTSATSLQGN